MGFLDFLEEGFVIIVEGIIADVLFIQPDNFLSIFAIAFNVVLQALAGLVAFFGPG